MRYATVMHLSINYIIANSR